MIETVTGCRCNSFGVSAFSGYNLLVGRVGANANRSTLSAEPRAFLGTRTVCGRVLVAVFGVGVFGVAGSRQGVVLLLKRVGDVFEEDQPKNDVLVDRRVHVSPKLVRRRPQRGLEPQIAPTPIAGALLVVDLFLPALGHLILLRHPGAAGARRSKGRVVLIMLREASPVQSGGPDVAASLIGVRAFRLKCTWPEIVQHAAVLSVLGSARAIAVSEMILAPNHDEL